MLSCKETSKLVSRSVDGKLGLRERLVVKLHLLMCARCRSFEDQMHFIREASRRLLARIESKGPKKR